MRGGILKKLLLVDTKGSGHHKNYAELVIESSKEKYNNKIYFIAEYEIENVKNINLLFTNHDNIILRAVIRVLWILKVFKEAKNNDINHIHFLYLDSLIIISPFIYLLLCFNFKFEITATLHHFKFEKLKTVFLKLLSKRIRKIVVHGKYLKDSLKNKSIKNVINIEYPATHNYFPGKNVARKLLDLNEKDNILLSLGGTRKNKGLDILLEALNYINSKNFLLIIAGKEEHFNKEFILKKINNYKEKVVLDLSFISDLKFSLYLEAGDAVILPYKRDFMGQSGPLIEGVNHNCFIISSNHGQIGHTVKNKALGFVFEENDSKDLSDKIKEFITNKEKRLKKINNQKYTSFKNEIDKDKFIFKMQKYIMN